MAIYLLAAFALSATSYAQGCEVGADTSTETAVKYLRRADLQQQSSECVQLAFNRIMSLPPAQAAAVLVNLLDIRRPQNKGEQSGIYLHGKGPDVLYPAIKELYRIGAPAEPALTSFIAEDKEAHGASLDNALYALLLIHHGNAFAVITELHAKATAATKTGDGEHLQTAAGAMLKWCDERWASKCEEALNK